MSRVFKSAFYLNYDNSTITKKYFILFQRKVLLSNKIIISILGCISIAIISLLGVEHARFLNKIDNDKRNDLYYFIILIISIAFTILDSILLLLTFIIRTEHSIHRVIGYVVYTLITLQCTLILQIMLESLYQINYQFYYFINVLEYIIKIDMHFIGVVEFHPSIYINIALPLLVIGLYFEIQHISSIIFDYGLTFIVLSIGMVISSYFITRIRKRNFHLLNLLDTSNIQRENILNSLNTGFLRIKDNQIEFVNSSLKNILKRAKSVKEQLKEKQIEDNNPDVIFDLLFDWTIRDLNPISHDSQTEENLTIPINTYQATLIKIKELFKQRSSGAEQFIFLNYSTIELINSNNSNEDSHTITYEILCDYDSNINQFELIFNDITRTREYEKKENDYKIQTVFLTKVAHEFKNPLICIQESATQIKEELITFAKQSWHSTTFSYETLYANFSLISSFIEYLLIRIKDLDYFTSTEINVSGSCQVITEQIEVRNIINFCVDIFNAKLRNNNKDDKIKLKTIVFDSIPAKIYSDCVKVKQILCQLISNAVKYTDEGLITLEVYKDTCKNNIIFKISDTGRGLNIKVQQFLHNSDFLKANKQFSIYAGLSIIRILTKQLNTEIHYTTKEKQGSSFWFSIPFRREFKAKKSVHLPHLNDSNSSNKTIKVDYLELEIPTTISSPRISYNIICADDEELARKALIRVINDTALKRHININIIEASDGSEILSYVFKHYYARDSQKIHAIISDQKMNFLNGSFTQNILTNLANDNKKIPFFIVSAFNNNARFFIETKCQAIFTKPFKKSDAQIIIDTIDKREYDGTILA